jgi:translation initiation factor 1 (eIF-1/SUI1)
MQCVPRRGAPSDRRRRRPGAPFRRACVSAARSPAAPLAELATRLKRLCGAGGAVKNGVIEIQGDHRDRVVAELGKLGLEAKRSGG